MALDFISNTVLIAVVTILAVFLLQWYVRRVKTCMPGPRGWPVVGSLLALDTRRLHLALQQWAKQYGPIYVVHLGPVECVVVSGYEELHEMLVTKGRIFAGRFLLLRDRLLSYESKDIASGSPAQSHWAPLRKSLHCALRLFGDGREQTDALLDIACQELVSEVLAHDGQAFDLHSIVYKFTMKSLFILLCGSVPSDDDSLFQLTIEFENCVMPSIGQRSGFELDLFPWLRHLGHPVWKKLQVAVKRRKDIFQTLWEYGQQTYSPFGEPQCLLHAAAQIVDPRATDQYVHGLDKDHMCGLVTDVLVAGTRTTVSSFYSLPNVLIHHPAVYARLQQEVDEVVGRERRPVTSDREHMPYTQAVVLEFMRYHSVLAAFPHSTLEDATLHDGLYTVPVGTLVLPLFWALHHDEAFWGDPYVFRPDRFLQELQSSDAGVALLPLDHPRRKHLMPFGAGSRVCVGEQFALRRLFIYTAFLAQTFDLRPDDFISKPVSCDPRTYTAGMVLVSPSYRIRMLARAAAQ